MMKVMLIGDSIRMNYQERVRAILGDRAVVHGPAENCRFAAYTLFQLHGWVPDDDYDVIHWNHGQWDTCYMPDGRIHTPLPAYLDLQKRIAFILRRKANRLIFATTTPSASKKSWKIGTRGPSSISRPTSLSVNRLRMAARSSGPSSTPGGVRF